MRKVLTREIVESKLEKFYGDLETAKQQVFRLNVDSMRGFNEIGSSAFRGFGRLTEVIIPEGIEKIGDYAFAECPRLKFVKLPSTLKEIGERAFYRCLPLCGVEFPAGLEKIGDRAFAYTDFRSLPDLPDSFLKSRSPYLEFIFRNTPAMIENDSKFLAKVCHWNHSHHRYSRLLSFVRPIRSAHS